MNNEQLIVKMAKELYALKEDLNIIREIAHNAFENSKLNDDKDFRIRDLTLALVDIMNEVEQGEAYE